MLLLMRYLRQSRYRELRFGLVRIEDISPPVLIGAEASFSPSLYGSVDPSFRAPSGRFKFTVRRHQSIKILSSPPHSRP